MICKKRLGLLLVFLLLSVYSYSLSLQETVALRLLLTRYQNNETSLLDQHQLLNQSLIQASERIRNSKKIILNSETTIQNLNKSLITSQAEVRKQKTILQNMEQSIQTLQTSYNRINRWNKILKWSIAILGSYILIDISANWIQ